MTETLRGLIEEAAELDEPVVTVSTFEERAWRPPKSSEPD